MNSAKRKRDAGESDVVSIVLVLAAHTSSVEVRVLIPHDGDGSAWGSGIYTDRQVEQRIHKNGWWIEKVEMDSGLGKERPERPFRMLHFEAKRSRFALPVNPHLNGVPFENSPLLPWTSFCFFPPLFFCETSGEMTSGENPIVSTAVPETTALEGKTRAEEEKAENVVADAKVVPK
jgi:hypothetical protein